MHSDEASSASFGSLQGIKREVGEEVDLIYNAVFSHTRKEALEVGKELEKLGAGILLVRGTLTS